MNPFEDFQKHAMREAMNRVYLWKHEHPDEYSRFSVEMMKVERNDFSCLERISRWRQALCRHPFLSNVANYVHPILKKYCLMMKELSLPVGSLTS